ncbi:hypothetical protein MGQ_00333 [Candida albicans P76067]|uniref:Uncharacterized protein n=1 Tax=Candida albicans P78048 TaxID=1094989 RepID=A0AB34Q043_CANAX|nr:hypothetical protein MG3_00384 [Candida albicans P78048]KGT72538.1 hypothetical protein MEK_00341 [Candida albicans 12C]KHC43184.1 hypothetical protein MGQ_00333 [Candida albicans P76067]
MSALKLAVPEVPKAPELIPVFTFNLKLASDPASIYANNESDKTLNLATIANGEVKTVPNKLGLELDIHSIYGTDDLNIKNSVSTASLDCKLYGKTANGSGVFIYYPGKVQLDETSVSVFTKKTKEAAIEDSYVTCNPTFYFDDKVEDKYKWVLKENFFARGRFGRDEDDVLYVQYYVYVVR